MDSTTKVIPQEFSVRFRYPVIFTRDLFAADSTVLADLLAPALTRHPHPLLLVYIDEGVMACSPGIDDRIAAYVRTSIPALALAAPPRRIAGGEQVKSVRSIVERLLREMADAQLDRHSFVMAIGGGAVLDAVGYAASLVHRGVRMIRVPTTVLAQNDAGVGVKTAINDPAGKNFFGTFAPPWAVINDSQFLAGLPDAEWRSGIAEAFKVAMIKDAAFFDWLCGNAAALAGRDMKAMEHLVFRCADLHLEHIRTGGDPFEMGEARPLDYGHWSAHYLESVTGYAIGHGQAVAIGIMLDAWYAVEAGLLPRPAAERLHAGLSASGFDLWHPQLEAPEGSGGLAVLDGLRRFREHLGGRLCITLPTGTGEAREFDAIDGEKVRRAVAVLKAWSLVRDPSRP